MQLRFTSLTVVSSRRDFHPQECAHAGRTKKNPRGLRRVGLVRVRTNYELQFLRLHEVVKAGFGKAEPKV